LLKNTEVDTKKVNKIAEGVFQIKELDTKKYQETLNLIDNLSQLAFNNLDNDILAQNYSKLVQKIY